MNQAVNSIVTKAGGIARRAGNRAAAASKEVLHNTKASWGLGAGGAAIGTGVAYYNADSKERAGRVAIRAAGYAALGAVGGALGGGIAKSMPKMWGGVKGEYRAMQTARGFRKNPMTAFGVNNYKGSSVSGILDYSAAEKYFQAANTESSALMSQAGLKNIYGKPMRMRPQSGSPVSGSLDSTLGSTPGIYTPPFQ